MSPASPAGATVAQVQFFFALLIKLMEAKQVPDVACLVSPEGRAAVIGCNGGDCRRVKPGARGLLVHHWHGESYN